MIKIKKCMKSKEENLEIDQYIPINLEFGKRDIAKDPTVYWRIGDFEKNLLEVGIGSENHDLRSITLVLCDKFDNQELPLLNAKFEESGCPVFSCEFDKELHRVDERRMISVFVGQNSVSVFFSEEDIEMCITNYKVEFFLNDRREWIGLRINDISADKIQMILQNNCS